MKKIDYHKKFAKKIEEANALISQAIADEVNGVEYASTWQSEYTFMKVWIDGKDQLKCAYLMPYDRVYHTKVKVDSISLKKDSEMEFDQARYLFTWIKRCLKNGYRQQKEPIPSPKNRDIIKTLTNLHATN